MLTRASTDHWWRGSGQRTWPLHPLSLPNPELNAAAAVAVATVGEVGNFWSLRTYSHAHGHVIQTQTRTHNKLFLQARTTETHTHAHQGASRAGPVGGGGGGGDWWRDEEEEEETVMKANTYNTDR